MAAEAATDPTAKEDETELGPSPELLAVLGYIFNVVGALVLLVMEDNEFVRHHAAQSLLFTAVIVVARFVVGIVAPILGFIPVVGDLLAAVLSLGLWAATVGGFLFLAYKAWNGERYAAPVLGEYIDEVEGYF